MVWLKLFRVKSFEAGRKPGYTIFGIKKPPLIDGPGKRKIRWVFNATGLQHFYNKRDILCNHLSPYHKLPKSLLMKERYRIYQTYKYRAALQAAIEKTEKFRRDRKAKLKIKGLDRDMQNAFTFLAGKNVATTVTIRKDEDDEDQYDLGIKKPKIRKQKALSPHRKGISSETTAKNMSRAKYLADMGAIQGKVKEEVKKVKSKDEHRNMIMTMTEYKKQKKEKEKKDPSEDVVVMLKKKD
jgi:hypothetical protein